MIARSLALLAAAALAGACAAPPQPARTAEPPTASPRSAAPVAELPLFDAHLHYSEPAWQPYPPERALAILRDAGVRRALVSSTPDDGTLRLHEAALRLALESGHERAADVVIPILRPYRTPGDLATWTQDPTIVPYLEGRLARGIYRGIGEFHLSAAETTSPVVRAVVRLAVERDLVLHVHGDDRAVEELARLDGRARILWAHAGMSAGPERLRRLLERLPALWVELALRSDVSSGGELDPSWRELFLRYPDRFMVGTDTWINEQWESYPEIQRHTRAWLAQLPREVAERIGYGNAEGVFGNR